MKVITIGRSKDEHNNIVVNDEMVSRVHLQMVMDEQGNYTVMDLNSTNGTYVNGRRISGEVPLKVTDEVKIGNTVLPWQSYFGNTLSKGSVASPSSLSSAQVPHQPSKPNPAPKRWIGYVVIGAVVLLLAGGGIGWKMYRDKQQKIANDKEIQDEERKKQEDSLSAEIEAAKRSEEYYKELLEDERRNAREERNNKILAQNKSVKAEKEKEKFQADAEQRSRESAKERDEAKENIDKLYVEIEKEKEKNNEFSRKAEENATVSSLNERMQKILNGWEDSKAEKFCREKKWDFCNKKKSYNYNPARKVIASKFYNLDNSAKKELIKEMEGYNNKTR